jgi:hypothetical protein
VRPAFVSPSRSCCRAGKRTSRPLAGASGPAAGARESVDRVCAFQGTVARVTRALVSSGGILRIMSP